MGHESTQNEFYLHERQIQVFEAYTSKTKMVSGEASDESFDGAAENQSAELSTPFGSGADIWEAAAESSVRVTLAGFAGSLIGLAKERQQHQQYPPHQSSFDTITPEQEHKQRRSHTASHGRPRRPPLIPIKTASTNLPIMWSISCMMFVVVLESCRWASPTGLLWQKLEMSSAVPSNGEKENLGATDFSHTVARQACTSLCDYAIGGAAAGLAGAVGQRKKYPSSLPPMSSLPSIRSGLATGLGLGLLAGIVQAAIDVGNMYLLENEQTKRHANDNAQDQEQRPID